MDVVKIILQYFLLPVLSAIFTYWFMKYRAKASKNDLHDKAVFDRIDSIINSQDVADVLHNARMGYLYMSTHSRSDDLHDFNQNIANRFIDEKLQKSYSDFDEPDGRLDVGINMLQMAHYLTYAVALGQITYEEAIKFSNFMNHQRRLIQSAEEKNSG